jgi:YHS domain-containing protein
MKSNTLLAALFLVTGVTAFAQDVTALHKKHFNLDNGIAIKGYDPVAYFTIGKAIKGNKDMAVYATGATYYFSSAANKELFKANPAKYQPEFGGWCAYAMGAKGEKVTIDPETFKITNGKLYLFYNKFFNNTLKDWNKDETNLTKAAYINWDKTFK